MGPSQLLLIGDGRSRIPSFPKARILTLFTSNLGVILLVDDAPDHLDLLMDSFSAFGFELTVVMDGETALHTCQHSPVDLILLDVMMPGISGFETCQRLKEDARTKDIPVIFMTDLTDNVSTVTGFSYGAVDYVTKPLHIEEVLARVTTHLKVRHLQGQLEHTIFNLQQEVAERKRAEGALRETMALMEKTNTRMRQDLEAAARVQHALLPDALPQIPGASFAWVYRPCAELGGDSLNVFPLDDRHIGMYVLDVSGHGVPASLLSVTLSRVLIPRNDPACLFVRSDGSTGVSALRSPAEVASRLNQMFPMTEETRQYFTMIYGILDTQDRTFRYVCAGHPPPIVSMEGQAPRPGEARSLAIGFFEDAQYEECLVELKPRSRIFLYSDGLLEAMSTDRQIFGETRLRSSIEAAQDWALQEGVDSILSHVLTWTKSAQAHDDLSLLAVEVA